MRVTINIDNPAAGDAVEDQLLTLEIFPEMTIETLYDSITTETQIPRNSQHLYHAGRIISTPTKTLAEIGVVDGDVMALHVRAPRQPGQQRAAASASNQARRDPEALRLEILASPQMRAQLAANNPQLAAALDNREHFHALFRETADRYNQERQTLNNYVERYNADPFDAEAQAHIEEMIRQERVMENLQNAMEFNPEVFGRVHMLYLDVEINGKKVKAMVDSGAQATIMSPSCAEECGIMRLVDKRFSGIARGVGTANIIGRVHLFQIKIGTLFLPCSFTVMEGKSVDLLLGLDMLKRHQATIDLARDLLVIQGEEVPFLSEADIPKNLTTENPEDEAKVEGPAGTTIDGRSGAIDVPASGLVGDRPSGSGAIAASTPAPVAPVAAPSQASQGFPESDVQKLIDLGFDRARATQALRAAGGNVEVAAGILFS